MWTPILYYTVPSEGIVALKKGERWPTAERDIAPYDLTYWAGWDEDDVPVDLKRMVIRAVENQYSDTGRGIFGLAGQTVLVPSRIARIGMGYSIKRALVA